MIVKEGRRPRLEPFDMRGVERGADGVLRYTDRPASLVAMLRATVDRRPGDEAVVELDGPRVSYRELWDRSARVAGGLVESGVARGDRVAITLGNGLDWCLAFYGILMAGAVVVPVNTRFAPAEVDYVLTDSGAGFVFRPGEPLPDGEPVVVDDLAPADLAAIFYTSGTTGFPKGAMTSHENFLANTETCKRVMLFGDDQPVRNLVSVPLFHVTGCNSQLLITVEIGGTTVIMPTFDVHRFLQAVEEERIDVLVSVPAIYWLAMNQPEFPDTDVSTVRWVTYGGAPTPPDVVARIKEAFPAARVGNGFGLTETSSVATFLPHEHSGDHADSVGLAAPVVELDIAEPDPASGVGELLIRAQNVVSGYWNKPEATEATFVEHWLHTGDLADIDDDGFVRIVDRMKDMVNRGGENVYCVEVENAIAACPGVFEVAVMGVPDTMMGEKVGAIIVPHPATGVDVDEVLAMTATRIADFKVPQYVVVRTEPLPRNPGGKILKPQLRKEVDWGTPVR